MTRRGWARRTMLALAVTAMAAGTGGSAAGAAASRPITFAAAPTGQSSVENIFTTNANGRDLRRLTDDGNSTNPVMSTNGRWIAYARTFVYSSATGETQQDLMVMRADGTGERRVTRTGKVDEYPTSWSADGSKIVIGRRHRRDDSRNGVFLIGRDGSGLRRLLGPRYLYADWSPTAQRLVVAYRSSPDSAMRPVFRIVAIDVDGTDRKVLTGTRHSSSEPRWSPDGSQIVFTQERHNTFTVDQIRVINSDGSGERLLADTAGQDMHPDWSPDGSKVVFWAPGYPSKIDLVDVATGKVTQLRTAYARGLSW